MTQNINRGDDSNPLMLLLNSIRCIIGIPALIPKERNSEPLNVRLYGVWNPGVSEKKNTEIAKTEIKVRYA